MEEKSRRTKLPHTVIVKAPGLLPMLYTPREICEELGYRGKHIARLATNRCPAPAG